MTARNLLALVLLSCLCIGAYQCKPPPPTPSINNFPDGSAILAEGPNYFNTPALGDGWWSPMPHDPELPTSTSFMVTCQDGAGAGLDYMTASYSSVNGNLPREVAFDWPDELLCERVCGAYFPDATPGNPANANNTCNVSRPSCEECQPETQQIYVVCTAYWPVEDPLNFCQEQCPDGQFCLAQFVSGL